MKRALAMANFAPVTLTIEGLPCSKKTDQRQIHAKGRVIPIPSAKYLSYERAACAQIARQFTGPPIDQRCHVGASFHRNDRTDVDNMLGGLLDILQKAKVLTNDRLVMSVAATKSGKCDGNPRVEVVIEPFRKGES